MMVQYMLVFVLVVAIVTVAAVTAKLRSARRVSSADKQKIERMWQHAIARPTPLERILEADKVLDETMKLLGATGSFADKLRTLGPRLRSAQPLWDAHKLRNRLAHEPGAQLTDREVQRAMQSFLAAKNDFLGH